MRLEGCNEFLYDLPLVALYWKGQRGFNAQVPALTFLKAQVYDFPYPGSHYLVAKPFVGSPNFMLHSKPALLDNKNLKP